HGWRRSVASPDLRPLCKLFLGEILESSCQCPMPSALGQRSRQLLPVPTECLRPIVTCSNCTQPADGRTYQCFALPCRSIRFICTTGLRSNAGTDMVT